MQDAKWQLTAKGKRKTTDSNQGGSLTLEELAVRGLIASEISRVSVSTLCAADCCPSRFRESYARLRTFTSRAGSEDLSPLLFPVFTHVFLRLLECNLPQRAEGFFLEFMGDHLENRPRELSELAQLAQGGCVAKVGALHRFDAYRSAVNLRPVSLDKLCRFLEKSEDLFLLDFIRQHISFDGIEQPSNAHRVVYKHQSSVKEESLESHATCSASCPAGALTNGPINRKCLQADNKDCCSVSCKSSTKSPAGPAGDGIHGCKHESKPLCNGIICEDRCDGAVLNGREVVGDHTIKTECVKRPKHLNGLQGSLDRSRLLQLVTELHQSSSHVPRVPSVCLYSISDLQDGVGVICSSRDMQVVCAGCDDSAIRLWKLSSQEGNSEKNTQCDAESGPDMNAGRSILRGHGGPVYGCSFSSDDRLLVSCGADRTVRLWDVMHSHELSCASSGHDSPIWDVAFSRSELLVGSASHDTTAKLWVVDNSGGLQQVRMLVGHMADVDCVRFHPNSAYVATASYDHSVRLWDVCSGHLVRLLTGSTAPVRCLAFSPCGRFLASSGDDTNISIFDLGSGQQVCLLQGHGDVVYTLAFSANGDVLASGGHDQQICLWNAKQALEQSASTPVTLRPTAGSSLLPTPPYQLACVSTRETVPQLLTYHEQNVLFAFGASNDL